jgi:sucrose-6-phosphate hydrolase SacC (GH32 family)
MGTPRVLTINSSSELEMHPAVEIETLRDAEESSILHPGAPLRQTLLTLRRELHLPLDDSSAKIAIRLLTQGSVVWQLLVDASAHLVTCGNTKFALPPQLKSDDALRIFIDASLIETFIAGREALTSRVYTLAPGKTDLQIELIAGTSLKLTQWPLDAISSDRLTT